MSTLYSVGQMNQLGDVLELAGFTPGDVQKLRNFHDWEALRELINGRAKIEVIKHIIDCSSRPFAPNRWSICPEDQLPNRITDKDFEWNPKNLFLYSSDKQRITGREFKKELESQKVLPANVLDYLFEYPELIPEEWKGKSIIFPGTIFRDFQGDQRIRYLEWISNEWRRFFVFLDRDEWFFGIEPAVCAI